MDLLKKIQSRYSHLSKNQKIVADYVVRHGIEASFDSIVELAQKIAVSEASIVRFSKQLGYEGYPKFRKALQAEFKKSSGSAARMNKAVNSVQNNDFFDRLFKRDIEWIRETRSKLSIDEFNKAVSLIWRARKIYIIGFRSAFSLAYFLYFRFLRLRLDARLISTTAGTSLVEQLALLDKGDLVIAIAFDQIPQETRIAVDYALKNQIAVLGIAHIQTSEIARKARICLLARRQPHRTQSLAAPMTLLNALALGVAARKKARSLKALRRLDSIERNYSSDDLLLPRD
jgi:DNA-binding MurR/RpiR family transcriptional regulator